MEEKKLELRVISDGTTMGTKVVDQDGNKVSGIRGITWVLRLDDHGKVLSEAEVELVKLPLEFTKPVAFRVFEG